MAGRAGQQQVLVDQLAPLWLFVDDRHVGRQKSNSTRFGADVDATVVEPRGRRERSRRTASERRRRGLDGRRRQVPRATDDRRPPARRSRRRVARVDDRQPVAADASRRRVVDGEAAEAVSLETLPGRVVHARVAQRHHERLPVLARQHVVQDRIDRRTDEVQHAYTSLNVQVYRPLSRPRRAVGNRRFGVCLSVSELLNFECVWLKKFSPLFCL